MQNCGVIKILCSAFLIYLFSVPFFASGREHVQVRSIEERQEQINGRLFLRRKKNIDGVRTDHWFIDGQSVERTLFETQYADAAAQEALAELYAEEKAYEEEQQFLFDSRKALYKKMLVASQKESADNIRQCNAFDLRRFFVFSDETFSSEEAFDQVVVFVEASLEERISSIESLNELQELLVKFDDIAKKLQKFFKATVERAINESSDTRVLKNLLSLVS